MFKPVRKAIYEGSFGFMSVCDRCRKSIVVQALCQGVSRHHRLPYGQRIDPRRSGRLQRPL
jgi:hypothetical protein